MSFAEPLERRMRVRFGGEWIADSENVLLLHEPSRLPVAYFPIDDLTRGVLNPSDRRTSHQDFGTTAWYDARTAAVSARDAAYRHTNPPAHARELQDRVAFVWSAMESFFEEDDQIFGHATDPYHHIDVRQADRRLTVRAGDRLVAATRRPLVLYESGFAPRWYVPTDDVDINTLTPTADRTFSPYKGFCTYYTVLGRCGAAWSYENPPPDARRIAGLLSFEPGHLEVRLDDTILGPEPETTIPLGLADPRLPGEQTPGRLS
ncbi:DUF427 domain-containing protein [Amycolatopsis sp. NPDC005232]|uniref:DUF427 domain-containing protein n=1 Tax=Amycolatopsis sp. NPDC005232 TaxID=3157027 RepID=UPI0033AC82A6